MPGAPTIAVMHVSKSYRTDGQTVVALPDTSLVADAGEVVWLHGESGVGKTTLLNIVGLLTSADTGDVELCGSPIRWTSASAMARLRRELIGFVFQTHNLVGWLDPLDNVLLAGGRVASTRAGELLADLGLAGRLHVQARRLSGGEQQRAAIVRAIINRPPIVLADEPISGLDDAVARRVLGALASIAQQGACVVVASHQALVGGYCTREVVMSQGHQAARRGIVS